MRRHVAPGTRIYSDNWAAYRSLNDLWYEHFSVTHKEGFKKVYENLINGDKVEVHTQTESKVLGSTQNNILGR